MAEFNSLCMTKKDFFILLLKVFGLYSALIALFSTIPNMLSYIAAGFDVFSLLWILMSVFLIIGFFVGLILKPQFLVRLLRLEKGFDEERIDLGRLSSLAIIKISLLLIGAMLVIEQLPAFLSHSYYAFKADLRGPGYETEANFDWAVSALKVILGFALVTQYDRLARFLMRKEEGEEV